MLRTLVTAAGVVICAVIALLLVVLVKPAHAADWVAGRGNETVRLTERPCVNEAVLKLIEPGVRERYMAGTAVVDGKRYAVCWVMTPAGAFLIYEDGDRGVVPNGDLKRPMDL